MAAPSSSSVSTASSQSPSGARPTTYPSQSGSHVTTHVPLPSPLSCPHPPSSSVKVNMLISTADARSPTFRTGSENQRSVPSPTTIPALSEHFPSPAISPTSSKRCMITFLVLPLFMPNQSRPVHPQPRSTSPPSLAHNLDTLIALHCHRNPSFPRRLSSPRALSHPHRPSVTHKYAFLNLSPSLIHFPLSRPTSTIAPRRPSPSNHVYMPDRPNITNHYPRSRARMPATQALCDHQSNSPEIPLLPHLLITALQYPRTHFTQCPIHNLRRPIFVPCFLPRP